MTTRGLADLMKESAMETDGLTIDDIGITGLSADSRAVRPGYLFAALPGSAVDGRSFIDAATKKGAAVVLAPTGTQTDLSIPLITDDNPRRRFALMAAAFYGRQPETVGAVTGTNGKTSVAWFARQLWEATGCRAAALGTLGIVSKARTVEGNLTTPDPVRLHEILAQLEEDGIGCLAMEASSHGLDQYRLDGVRVGIGVFTNISRDHLDYHVTMEAYVAAKMRLFTEVMAPGGVAVLNADVPEFAALEAAARGHGHRVLSYGEAGTDIRLLSIEPVGAGLHVKIAVMEKEVVLTLPLVGTFQAMNAFAALGMAMASERVSAADLVPHLESLLAVPGRMERVGKTKTGADVYVDYAHTPDALSAALSALCLHTMGQLSVVFGCGGERDKGKRAEMGRIATELADRVTVTDDNPRGEDASTIRADVMAGAIGADTIADRAEAIEMAMADLGPGDILLVAGKGHETGQIIGDEVLAFDDRAVVRSLLKGGAS